MHDSMLILPQPGVERIDVRLKLICAMAAIAVAIGATHLLLPAAVLLGALAVLVAIQTSPSLMLRRLVAPAAFAAMIAAARAMLGARNGLSTGAMLVCVVSAAAAVLLSLSRSTSPHRLLGALRWMRIPSAFVQITSLMHRYIFCLFEQAATVMEAQKTRLGYQNIRTGIHSAGSLTGMVLVRALEQADRTHEAMLARGYAGQLTAPVLPALSRSQKAIICAIPLLAAALLLAERWVL